MAAKAAQPHDVDDAAGWVWKAFARGVRTNVMSEITIQVVRIGGFVVLARALAPSDFGMFRVLTTISAILLLLNQGGIPDTLVQRSELSEDHEATAWWTSLMLSLMGAGVLFVSAPLIARLMGMPAMPAYLRVLCVPIVLESTASVPLARLMRRLEYGVLAVAEVLGEVGFLTVSLGLLYLGIPRWSLVGGLAARQCSHALTVWSAGAYVPRRPPRRAALVELRGFAGSVLVGRLVYSLSSNADYLLVGRLLGASALGFYGMAWDLLRFLPDRLYQVAGRVTMPAFCRVQDRAEELQRAYLGFTDYVSRIVIPVVVCFAVAAPELLTNIYGRHWLPAALPLRILAIGLTTIVLRSAISAIYYSKGRPILDLYIHGSRLVLIVVTILVLAPTGLLGVSAGMSAVEMATSAAGVLIASRLIGISLLRMVECFLPSIKTAALCALATMAGKAVIGTLHVEGFLQLPLIVIPPAAGFCWREAATARQLFVRAFGWPAELARV